MREFIKDTRPKTNTTRGGRKPHRPRFLTPRRACQHSALGASSAAAYQRYDDTLGRVSATLSRAHGCSECRSQATVPRLPRLGRAAVGRRSGRMWANRRSGQIGGAFRPKSSCASCQSGCNHHSITGSPVISHATARRSHTAAFWRHCRSLGRQLCSDPAHGCATSADPPFGASAHE